MKTFKHYLFFAVLLSAIYTTSCKKDSETDTFPEITFTSPSYGAIYNMFDSVYISASVSDKSKLTSISISLTTLGNVPVQSGITYSPGGKTQSIDFKYELYEYRLPSGYYYINISASNGLNSAFKQQLIYINASPVVKTGYYFFSDNGTSTTILKQDTAFSQVYTRTMNGAYTGSAISSYCQKLYVAGGAYQNFQTYDIGTGLVKWSVVNLGGGSPFFSSCDGDGLNVILGYNNGAMKRYDQGGTTITNFVYTNNDYYPEHGELQGNYYVSHYQSRSSSNKKLVVFSTLTGAAMIETPITFKSIGIFDKSTSEAYVVGNDNSNQAQLNVYNVVAGGLQNPISLPVGSVLSACKVDSNTLLIGHSDGNIYKYQYSNNNLISIQSGVTANKMKYNSGENYVYVASAKQFTVYSLAGFSLSPVKNFTSADTIRDFHVIYNK